MTTRACLNLVPRLVPKDSNQPATQIILASRCIAAVLRTEKGVSCVSLHHPQVAAANTPTAKPRQFFSWSTKCCRSIGPLSHTHLARRGPVARLLQRAFAHGKALFVELLDCPRQLAELPGRQVDLASALSVQRRADAQCAQSMLRWLHHFTDLAYYRRPIQGPTFDARRKSPQVADTAPASRF